jgi:hypothetical protein
MDELDCSLPVPFPCCLPSAFGRPAPLCFAFFVFACCHGFSALPLLVAAAVGWSKPSPCAKLTCVPTTHAHIIFRKWSDAVRDGTVVP